jgi:hypothetical protein
MPTHTGIFMSARIYSRIDNRTYDLWTPNSGVALQSISVEVVQGQNNTIQISLAMPYDLGIEYLESTLFAMDNVLLVQFGYPESGFYSAWYAGLIQKPDVTLGDTVEISLTGLGAGALAMGRSSSKSYKGTLQSIVLEMSQRMGWEVDWKPSLGAEEVEILELNQNGESFWTCLVNLLNKYKRAFHFYSQDNGRNVLAVYPQLYSLSLPPSRSFVKWGVPNRALNEYPLISFSTSQQVMILPGSDRTLSAWLDMDGNVQSYEAKSGETLSTLADGEAVAAPDTPKDQIHPETGNKISISMQPDETGATTQVSPPGTGFGVPNSTLEQLAKNSIPKVTESFQASCSTIGIPNLLPGELVQIKGCSRYFDGAYTVTKVTHQVSESGYTSEFEVTRYYDSILVSPVKAPAPQNTLPTKPG